MSFDNLMVISCQYQCVCKIFITIFHSVQVHLFIICWHSAKLRPMINVILQFRGLDLVNINLSAKIFSKYSKRFKSYGHFSQTVRGQNLHKLSGERIKCLIIGHTLKVNLLWFQLTFLGSCNLMCTCKLRPGDG